MTPGYVALALVLGVLFFTTCVWRMSGLLLALHGRDRVGRSGLFGPIFAVLQPMAPPDRHALYWAALILPMFPLGFALFSDGPAMLILLVGASATAGVSILALRIDRQLRDPS
jgi:hypothetical protein